MVIVPQPALRRLQLSCPPAALNCLSHQATGRTRASASTSDLGCIGRRDMDTWHPVHRLLTGTGHTHAHPSGPPRVVQRRLAWTAYISGMYHADKGRRRGKGKGKGAPTHPLHEFLAWLATRGYGVLVDNVCSLLWIRRGSAAPPALLPRLEDFTDTEHMGWSWIKGGQGVDEGGVPYTESCRQQGSSTTERRCRNATRRRSDS